MIDTNGQAVSVRQFVYGWQMFALEIRLSFVAQCSGSDPMRPRLREKLPEGGEFLQVLQGVKHQTFVRIRARASLRRLRSLGFS